MSQKDYDMEPRWYVVHTYSGYENKVKTDLEKTVKNRELEEYFFDIVVPMEEQIEIKDGKRKTNLKKVFPGYVLIEMVMSDEAWYIVRNTQGVTGFIGSSGKGAKPIPLLPQEVDKILGSMGMSRIDASKELEIGKKVKILDGPFQNMEGKIDSVDLKTQKVNVTVDLFGQETKVEVDMKDIEGLE